MRIAYCSQTYPPMVSGAAIVAQGLAEGMANRWHEVLVLTASDQEQAYIVSRPNLTVQRFRSYINPLRVGQRLSLWPHTKLIAALRAFKPDIIHTHDPFQFGWSALAYARQTRTPIILTTHQVPDSVVRYLPNHTRLRKFAGKILWLYAQALLSKFDAVLAPSPTCAEFVATHTNIKPLIAGFGVNPKIFGPTPLSAEAETAWRTRLGLQPSTPILLHVGRLDRDKEVDVALRAAALAIKNNTAEILLVGDGTEKARLAALAQELGIGERCHFPGFIRAEAGLAEIYKLSNIFIFTSRIETQGLVLLEAAACGLPLVAFHASCIPEIVKDEINGYLAAPGDINGLAASLQRLLASPDQAHALGQAGSVLSRALSLEKTLSRHEAIYLQTIAQKARAGIAPATTGRDRVRHFGASG